MLTLSMLQVTFLGVSFLPRCTDGYGGLVFTSFLAQKVFTVGGLHYVRGYPWMGWLVSHWSPLDMNPTATKPFTGRCLALSMFTAASLDGWSITPGRLQR